jgi:SAM-dependent methyltransferase
MVKDATTPAYADLYDAYYYAHGCGNPYQRDDTWLNFFAGIAGRLVDDIGPTSVLDAGCAMGFLVEKLRERGVEAFGIDISEYAIQNVYPDIQDYCWVGSVLESFPQRYDLIVSIEVLEHLPPEEAQPAISNLCAHSDDVIFSATPTDFTEPTHLNVQPPEHWAKLFARQGFYRDMDFEASFITPWAARFRRRDVRPWRLVTEYERKLWLLSQESLGQRELNVKQRRAWAEQQEQMAVLKGKIDELEADRSRLQRSFVFRVLRKLGMV